MHKGRPLRIIAITSLAIAMMMVLATYYKSAKVQGVIYARVNGVPITMSDLEIAKRNLPQNYAQQPDDKIHALLLNIVVHQKMSALKARKQGIAKDPEFKRLLNYHKEAMLATAGLNAYLKEEITEARLRAIYEKIQATIPVREEKHIISYTFTNGKAANAFAENPKEYRGSERLNSTDMGFKTVKNLPQALKNLEKDDTIVDTITTGKQKKWVVYLVRDTRKIQEQTYADLRSQLEQRLIEEYKAKYYKALEQEFTVEYYGQDGEKIQLPKEQKQQR